VAEFTKRQSLRLSATVLGGGAGVMAGIVPARAQDPKPDNDLTVEQWMERAMLSPRAAGSPLHVSRFADPTWFLTKPISWRPNPDQVGKFEAVDVPVGFVTDFASVPRPFWSFLRPDGEYTYAAILHDYLYWTQSWPRDVADEIFKLGMQDFNIDNRIIAIVFAAVRAAGGSSWTKIGEQKAAGEKRILRQFPDDPRVRWSEWKKRPDVFVP
jgi:hypothetical protein